LLPGFNAGEFIDRLNYHSLIGIVERCSKNFVRLGRATHSIQQQTSFNRPFDCQLTASHKNPGLIPLLSPDAALLS
jgi:hypothetical protein